MEATDDALRARVQVLLAHLEEMPSVAAALPFTVEHLVEQVRSAYSVESRDGPIQA